MFQLTDIETDNAAFEDNRAAEVARILRKIASDLDNGRDCGLCVDSNGNTVANWSID